MPRTSLTLILCILIASSCKTILLNKATKHYSKRNGEQFTSMRIEDTTGKHVTVEPIKDKVMYIAFWATWCGPCIGKIPDQDSLMERLKDDTSIMFINVCVDKPENKQQWLNIIRKKNYQGYNVFLDKDAAEVDSLRLIEEGFPFHLVVGKNGKVLGCDIAPDEELLVSYALLQAQDGKTVNESLRNMLRQSKRMHHHDDAETKAFVAYLEKYVVKKQ